MADKYFKLSQSGQQVQNLLNQIPTLAPLNSPALTGTPTAPTQALTDSSTRLATTKFVDDYVADYDSSSITPLINAKQDEAVTVTVTLPSASWSGGVQTVTASGVTASNIVFVSPAPASFLAYAEAQIYCSAQGANSLTFTCQAVPSSDLTVNAVIL